MGCDMCGKEGPRRNVFIEGTEMSVCKVCQKFGKPATVSKKPSFAKKDFKNSKRPAFEKPTTPRKEKLFIVVEDYADIIKSKREELKLTQEELAEKLNEKLSILQKVEAGNFRPNIPMAKKLEKFFKVKLVESHVEEHKAAPRKAKSEGFTLGDMIKIKKR